MATLTDTHNLAATAFLELPLGTVQPEGWLRNQLVMQADGLTGHLDEIWEPVGPNSGWLGGPGDNWERGPYYCDGLIPLAYLLGNARLIRKAENWIEWTLNSQTAEGNFGPPDNLDWWPRMVMLKALVQYYEATRDVRVIPFMTRYFRYQAEALPRRPLENWGWARGAENVYCTYWLYSITRDESLLSLAELTLTQMLDWTDVFTGFPFVRPTGFYYDAIGLTKAIPSREEFARLTNYHAHHVVNVAMGIKNPALHYLFRGDRRYRDAADLAIHNLTKHHGQVAGIFTGDEHLSGRNPSQGTELCAVVEYMFSLHILLKTFGEAKYADLLEKVAYNALPATLTKDLTAHQYDQQANQVLVSLAKRNWYDNNDEANLFGLEPNFGCCTANMHQGWPKFVKNLWFATPEGGLVAAVYAPSSVTTRVGNGTLVTITETTEYPFHDRIDLTVHVPEPTAFPLHLRIPHWCDNAEIEVNNAALPQGQAGTYYRIARRWQDGDTVRLTLPMKVTTSAWFQNSAGIERGPLVFALRIKERWQKLRGAEPFADWEVHPDSPWNYALLLNPERPGDCFSVETGAVPFQPYDSSASPVVLKGKARRLKDWGLEQNSAGTLPMSPVTSEDADENVELVPYGAAKLRIAEFPWIAAGVKG